MLPVPVLDDKSFAQLMDDVLKLIPRYAPEWTDFNPHDPGITLLELFAWLTEGQRYHLDQIRGEHLRKYLKLMGASPKPSQPAGSEVAFALKDLSGEERFIPAGTRLTADGTIFVTTEEVTVGGAALDKMITVTADSLLDQTEAAGHEGLTFKAFGEQADAGSSLYLGFRIAPRSGLRLPVSFRLYEEFPAAPLAPETEEADIRPSAVLSWEYWSASGEWLELTVERDETICFTRSGRIWFRTPEDPGTANLFPIVTQQRSWFRCTVVEGGYELAPRMDSVMLYTMPVVQMNRRSEMIGRSNGLGGQTFRLSGQYVLPDEFRLEVKEPETGAWTLWTLAEDLDASGPDDRHFMLEGETGTIRFGDGIRGMPPPSASGDNVQATYWITAGSKGNAAIGAIGGFAGDAELSARLTVRSLVPAEGGKDAETLEEAFLRADKETEQCTRAVTSGDYERLALSAPGLRVARTKAFLLPDGAGNAVAVTVVPYSDKANPLPGQGFIDTVARYLDRHRLIGTQVKVIAPDYVKVKVYALVTPANGYDERNVAASVRQTLDNFLHPLKGGADGSGWPFGRTVYLSELYALIDRILGVESVRSIQLFNSGGGGKLDEQGNLTLKEHCLVYSDQHQIELERPAARAAGEGAAHVRIGPN